MGTENYLIIALGAIILCLLSKKIKQLFAYFFWETVIVGVVDKIEDQNLVYPDIDDRDLISNCWVCIKGIYPKKDFRINIHSLKLLKEIQEKNKETISFSIKKPSLSLVGYDGISLNL